MNSRILCPIILGLILPSVLVGQEVRSLLNRSEKFTTDGKVYEDDLYGFPTYHEDGSLNGVAYRIYFLDGSGTFEGVKGNGVDPKVIVGRNIDDLEKNWMISCREDAVDILTCLMVFPGISVLIDTKGQEFVAIHGDSDPRGAVVEIRFDSAEKVVGGEDSRFGGTTANRIINRLKTANQITTSFERTKTQTHIIRILDLYGFNEALSYVQWVVGKCKSGYDSRKGTQAKITGGGFQTCSSK